MNFAIQEQLADPKSLLSLTKNQKHFEFDFATYEGPRRFYDLLTRQITMGPEKQLSYSLTDIPNNLKVLDQPRRLILAKFEQPCQCPLEKLVGHRIDATFYLHVGRGEGSLTISNPDLGQGSIPIKKGTTTQFFQYQTQDTRFVVRTEKFLAIGLEILDPLPDNIYQKIDPMEYFEFKPPLAVINFKSSFISSPMTLQEVRNRLLFLDIECGSGDADQPVLFSIAAINYEGERLMVEHVCPRVHVNNYRTAFHGIAEADLIGQRDEMEVRADIERMCRGRIIVGHDLHLEHSVLCLDLERIAGVRDLQGSAAVAEVMQEDSNSWSLDRMAKRFGVGQQSSEHNALEDVLLIRAIYMKIEHRWKDTPMERLEELRLKAVERKPPPEPRLTKIHQTRSELQIKKRHELIKKQAEEEERARKEEKDKLARKVEDSFVLPPFPEKYRSFIEANTSSAVTSVRSAVSVVPKKVTPSIPSTVSIVNKIQPASLSSTLSTSKGYHQNPSSSTSSQPMSVSPTKVQMPPPQSVHRQPIPIIPKADPVSVPTIHSPQRNPGACKTDSIVDLAKSIDGSSGSSVVPKLPTTTKQEPSTSGVMEACPPHLSYERLKAAAAKKDPRAVDIDEGTDIEEISLRMSASPIVHYQMVIPRQRRLTTSDHSSDDSDDDLQFAVKRRKSHWTIQATKPKKSRKSDSARK